MTQPIAYLGDHLLLTMTRFGRKIYVDGRDLSLAPHLLMQGDWERWVSQVMQRTLLDLARQITPGAVVLDVGANFGWYSLLGHFTAEGVFQVRAYEPNPHLARLLRMTFSANGIPEAHVCEVAVGDVTRKVELSWTWSYLGNGEVSPTAEQPKSLLQLHRSCMVDQVRLDDEVAPGTRVALIKIDVEGCEPEVLRGAARVLRENPGCVILVEWHCDAEHTAAMQALVEQGYSVAHIDHNGQLRTRPSLSELLPSVPTAEMLYVCRTEGRA